MSEFKREKRYQVIKLSNPNWKGSCVVVEDDWPEYEIVWKMIQDRVEGKPNIIEQQAANIAELREALIAAHNKICGFHLPYKVVPLIEKALASTDSSNWLAEQKAQWRREVLEEVYKEVNCGITHVRWALEIIRRMAEQPESN